MLTLHDLELSGNAYKVRLFLALLGREYRRVDVDFQAGANRAPAFLALNPLGQVPVLQDGDLVLRDSQAILVYLAARHGGEDWLPRDAAGLGRVMQWLSTAANEIAAGPARARACKRFGRDGLEPALQVTQRILPVLEQRLAAQPWLELDRPTIADLACYPYVGLAHEGEVSLAPFPAIRAWCRRIEDLPGYVSMPGLPAPG